jgi:DNA-binding LacI/PurR family transcriptional regulator
MRTNPRQHLDSISEEDPTYLESLIREDFERCHPGEYAGGSQAARVLFERGQRSVAGLDGGSGRSRRSRMRSQGISTAPDDHIRSFR